MKVLVVYGTRYGATAEASDEIARILGEAGAGVKVVDAKKEKVRDISPYGLVVVGSGMQMGKWTGEADAFLKRCRNELDGKKLAIFVSTMKLVSEREGKPEDVAKIRKTALEDKVAEYGLNPVSLGFFGGVLDYNRMNLIFRRTMGFLKPQLEKDGFKEIRPGVYDLRDMEEIRSWAKRLADLVN